MTDKLMTADGVEVTIMNFEQELTYGDLWEVIPDMNFNIEKIYNEKNNKNFKEIYVIVPKQTHIANSPSDRYEIPSVTCRATVETFECYRDKNKHVSQLTIVWFQNDYAFPIDDEIIEKIKEISFYVFCGEYCF